MMIMIMWSRGHWGITPSDVSYDFVINPRQLGVPRQKSKGEHA